MLHNPDDLDKKENEEFSKLRPKNDKGWLQNMEEKIVICPEENFFWPIRNILIMWCAILSSVLYGFCAVYRKDVDYSDYLEYLNDLSYEWSEMNYFSPDNIRQLNKA